MGTIGVPSLFCAITGTVLSVSVDMMGYLQKASEWLARFWEQDPYFLVEPIVLQREAEWVITFVVCWLVAALTLGSLGTWRRMMVGLMVIVVLLGFAPTLMLWGILWLPWMYLIALIWTWACALIYGAQHQMPGEVQPENELNMKVETIPFPSKRKAK